MHKLRTPSKTGAYFLAFLATLITIAVVLYPEQAYEASLDGLKLWWDIVFPALLPFFIISEILMGLGVVHFIGALLEPLMQPLFRVPGVGGFVMAIGLASGYPLGAKIATRLREQNLCTRNQAERLLCFTNTADPLFMVGAVAVGMFHDVRLASAIAAAHYISSIMVGLTMRFWGQEEFEQKRPQTTAANLNIFRRALRDLYQARKTDGRPIGKLLGDAVTSSMNTSLFIAGFIILFAVLVKIMLVTGVIDFLATPLAWILQPLGISSEVVFPLVSGLCEIDLGAHQASLAPLDLKTRLILVGAIIAWSGLSVHGQVAAIISTTDMRYYPYLWSRILHAIYAGLITYIIYNPEQPALASIPSFWQPFNNFWVLNLELLSARLFTAVFGLVVLGLLAALMRTGNKIGHRPRKVNPV